MRTSPRRGRVWRPQYWTGIGGITGYCLRSREGLETRRGQNRFRDVFLVLVLVPHVHLRAKHIPRTTVAPPDSRKHGRQGPSRHLRD